MPDDEAQRTLPEVAQFDRLLLKHGAESHPWDEENLEAAGLRIREVEVGGPAIVPVMFVRFWHIGDLPKPTQAARIRDQVRRALWVRQRRICALVCVRVGEQLILSW